MTCEERAPNIFLHAAGVLEDEEQQDVETHLAGGCERCTAELAAAQRALAELSTSLDPVDPSPAVRQRLLRRIRQDAPPEQGRTGSPGRLALAAGVGALVAAGLTVAALESLRTGPVRDELAALEAEHRTLADAHAALQEDLAEQEEIIAEQDSELIAMEQQLRLFGEKVHLLRAPGLEVMALAATSGGEAGARVFWEWEDYACYLHATGMRPPAEGHAYVLWLFNEAGAWIRAGSFRPDGHGEATFFTRLPRDTGRVLRAVVSEESPGEGVEPAGDIRLRGGRT